MEPASMKEALNFLTDLCSMKDVSGGSFALRLEGTNSLEGDDSIQTEISLDGFIKKTNENSYKMCLGGNIPISEKGGERRTKGDDRFQVCVNVGEKLIACMKAANSDKKA